MREETVIARAAFDEKLPTYWMLNALTILFFTFIGIAVIPVWLFLGWRIHRKQYERLECELTERTLNVRRGFLFRVEKSIPLDKIQDVSMKEGPILRHLGLSALGIETAGSSGPQGGADAQLTGVVDAPAFRDAILNQRDLVVSASGPAPAGGATSATAPPPSDGSTLEEISATLKRIEALLEREPRD
jgi:putative membrane protein